MLMYPKARRREGDNKRRYEKKRTEEESEDLEICNSIVELFNHC